jgi:hypothetical protein
VATKASGMTHEELRKALDIDEQDLGEADRQQPVYIDEVCHRSAYHYNIWLKKKRALKRLEAQKTILYRVEQEESGKKYTDKIIQAMVDSDDDINDLAIEVIDAEVMHMEYNDMIGSYRARRDTIAHEFETTRAGISAYS